MIFLTNLLMDTPEDDLTFTFRIHPDLLDTKMVFGIPVHEEMQNIARGEFKNWLTVVYALDRDRDAGLIRHFRVKNRDITVLYPNEDEFVDVEYYFDEELIASECKKFDSGESTWIASDDDFLVQVSFIKFRRKVNNV